MGVPLQSLELLFDMTIFTGCSVAVLLTGADSARERALRHGQRLSHNVKQLKTGPEVEKTFIAKMLKELQNLFVVSASLASIYSIAEMYSWDIVTAFIKSKMFYVLGGWCFFIAATTIVSAILKRFRPHFFHLYFLVALDTIGEINRFLIACVRVQIQLSTIVIPLVIVFIFPMYSIEISALTWDVLLLGVCCYIILLAVTCVIIKKRSARRHIYYDLGCLLSTMAMFSFIYDQNVTILSSLSPPPPGLNGTQ